MTIKKGDQLWKLRTRHGRHKKYEDEETLWAACVEYFEWCENNPLEEEKLVTDRGKPVRRTVKHMRPMTIQGLCVHIGISDETWSTYRKGDYSEACNIADQIMFEQKFAGASAGLMAPQLIARYLGLADKTESNNKHLFDFSGLSDGELKTIVSGEK